MRRQKEKLVLDQPSILSLWQALIINSPGLIRQGGGAVWSGNDPAFARKVARYNALRYGTVGE